MTSRYHTNRYASQPAFAWAPAPAPAGSGTSGSASLLGVFHNNNNSSSSSNTSANQHNRAFLAGNGAFASSFGGFNNNNNNSNTSPVTHQQQQHQPSLEGVYLGKLESYQAEANTLLTSLVTRQVHLESLVRDLSTRLLGMSVGVGVGGVADQQNLMANLSAKLEASIAQNDRTERQMTSMMAILNVYEGVFMQAQRVTDLDRWEVICREAVKHRDRVLSRPSPRSFSPPPPNSNSSSTSNSKSNSADLIWSPDSYSPSRSSEQLSEFLAQASKAAAKTKATAKLNGQR